MTVTKKMESVIGLPLTSRPKETDSLPQKLTSCPCAVCSLVMIRLKLIGSMDRVYRLASQKALAPLKRLYPSTNPRMVPITASDSTYPRSGVQLVVSRRTEAVKRAETSKAAAVQSQMGCNLAFIALSVQYY